MNDEFTSTEPFYCGIEVKIEGGDAYGEMIQLLVWLNAVFQHRRVML